MAADGSNLNIEEIFVGLRRAWHPPSAAVEASFTRLSQTLGAIYRALRADPDLADLHAEVYDDFPGADVVWPASREAEEYLDGARPGRRRGQRADDARPGDRQAERRRKGFYLCNSLIQLMEDVYHDLRLEPDYRHPDNRGWMNLFRHWSRSDTFRMTWAVSASTYGLRFQDFCGRRLGLSLGVTDLTSVWDAWYSPKHKGQPNPLDAPEAKDLDHNERRLIEILTSKNVRGVDNPIERKVMQILAARLLVPSNRTAEIQQIGRRALTLEERNNLLSLNFGMVAITARSMGPDDDPQPELGSGALLTLAVRRHLRDQGLGRRLMHDLVCRLGVEDVELPEAGELIQIGLPAGSRESIKNLFRSVVNEVDLSEQQKAQRAPEDQAGAEAIFGAVPRLPYSGVVRPPGVTWAHAVGFCFWVLAGAGGIEEEEEIATRKALSDWAGGNIHDKETESVADESKHWYLSAKRPVEALEPEIDTIIGRLSKEPWFRRNKGYRKRLEQGLDNIADAYDEDAETVSGFEEYLVDKIKKRLGSAAG